MALSKDEVIDIVKGFLSISCRKHKIKQAYIFGSFARGKAKEYSDIDLALVLDTMQTSEDSPFDEGFEIFHEAQEYNSLIEAVCFPKEVFDGDGGTLIKMIKKEGIRVF